MARRYMVMDLLQGHQIYEIQHILQEHDQIGSKIKQQQKQNLLPHDAPSRVFIPFLQYHKGLHGKKDHQK